MKRCANRIILLSAFLMAVSLIEPTARAQEESPTQVLLQQMQRSLALAQQLPPEQRTNVLRELERTVVKMQQLAESQQQQRGNSSSAPLIVRSNGVNGGLNVQVGGAWWNDAAVVARLGLTEDQKTRIERAFENHRLSLISSRDLLQKEEAQLARALDAEQVEANAILTQIDRVVDARGEMERVNAAMTLEMRQQLTRVQWTQLQAQPPAATVTLQVPLSPVPGSTGASAGRGATPGQRGARGQ